MIAASSPLNRSEALSSYEKGSEVMTGLKVRVVQPLMSMLTEPTISFSSSTPFFSDDSSAVIFDDLQYWGAIHQLLSIILKLRTFVLSPVSNLPCVVKVNNYSLIGE
jgi:hypothetical protein